MPPLYVVEQGAKVKKRRRCLVVEKEGETLQRVLLIKVDQVLLFGNISITTPALTYLMQRNIDVVFCDRHGRYRGRVVGETGGHSQLRRYQYRRVDDPAFALKTGRTIVQAKLGNSRTLLLRYRRRRQISELNQAIHRLSELIERTERSQTINSLLGVEGRGTAVYFEGLRLLLPEEGWTFEKRVRRPPTDPVNVLLSFGYTVLTRRLEAAVERVGLDPYLGCLHADSYNRPSLALDLTEEFRSIIVDSVTLRCLNSGLLQPEQFKRQEDPKRPILLEEEGRNRFIQELEARLAQTFTHPANQEKVTYLRCFDLQARQMAQAFQNGGLYRPFVVR